MPVTRGDQVSWTHSRSGREDSKSRAAIWEAIYNELSQDRPAERVVPSFEQSFANNSHSDGSSQSTSLSRSTLLSPSPSPPITRTSRQRTPPSAREGLPPRHQGRNSPQHDIITCNLSRATDLTVHLELDVSDDIDADLEAFSRLCRLGNFTAAKQKFKESLMDQKRNPYVLVQYAQMLLDSGDYKTLMALKTPPEIEEISSTANLDHDLLQYNWYLIRAVGRLYCDGELGASDRLFEQSDTDYSIDEIDEEVPSTQLQVLCLRLRLLYDQFSLYPSSDKVKTLLDLSIYTKLLTEGRIWDFRDVCISLASYDYDIEWVKRVFKVDSASGLVYKIAEDWDTTAYEEPTKIALLDIALSLFFTKRQLRLVDDMPLMNKATSLVSSILQHSPDFVHSRQYIRWILAKAFMDAYEAEGIIIRNVRRDGLRGVFLLQGHSLSPPVYIPERSENPRLPVKRHHCVSELIPLVKTALVGAKSLGDYDTEALCLQALIYLSEDPSTFYDDLAQLQRDIQGDFSGCLRTYLSKYLLCQDQDLQSRLREDMWSLGHGGMLSNLDPQLEWARLMVTRALSTSAVERADLLRTASALTNWLPTEAQHLMMRLTPGI